MADTGRCAVLDVSEVAKERPTGYLAGGDVSDDDNDGDGDDQMESQLILSQPVQCW